MPSPKQRLWSRLMAVGLPFFRSGPRRQAFLALGLLVAFLLGINGLNVINSFVGRDFMSALEKREVARFYSLAVALAGVFAVSTAAEVLARYIEQRLGLVWREWLTRLFLSRYLDSRAYHRLAGREDVDNPDQRISEDVRTFTTSTLSFLVLFVNGILTFLAFAGVLWSISPLLFLISVLYAAAGSLGTVLLGRRLVRLNNQQLQKEADFRFALGRVREHAVAVAQQEGEGAERARLGGRLGALVENFRAIIDVSRNLGFFTTGYNYMTQIIPAAVVASLYFHDKQMGFGTVTQSAMAFTQLLGAFSLIVTQFQELSSYAVAAERLGALWEATEPAPPPPQVSVGPAGQTPREPGPAPAAAAASPAVHTDPDEKRVAYENLTLRTPRQGRPLIRDLCLEVPEGKRVIITGPHGAGKTALLLATAGLWWEGQGRVVRPERLMFVPQRPYTPTGRLRDVLLYGLDRADIPDEQLRAILHESGLEALADQLDDLDAERDWPAVLSEGEQRALAFARLLLANPRFAFLDDPAGALGGAEVERLYAVLARTSITYVSVGSHPTLLKYHDLRLELRRDGGWRVEPAGTAGPTP